MWTHIICVGDSCVSTILFNISDVLAHNCRTPYIAVIYHGSHFDVVRDRGATDFYNIMLKGVSHITSFIPPRHSGEAAITSNYRTEYIKYNTTSNAIINTIRSDARVNVRPTSTSSTRTAEISFERKDIASTATQINRLLERYTRKVVSCVERCLKCHVKSCTLQYVLDDEKNAWLVTTKNFQVGILDRRVTSPQGKQMSSPKRSFKSTFNLDNMSAAFDSVFPGKEKPQSPSTKFSNGSMELDAEAINPHLGTSQSLSLCPGDFCHYNWKVEDPGRITLPKLGNTSDTSDGPSVLNEDKRKISFKSIVQARGENEIVRLLLRRHQTRQDNELLKSMIVSKLSATLSKKYPAKYYRETDVCPTCYLVYSKVDKYFGEARVRLTETKMQGKNSLRTLSDENAADMKKLEMPLDTSQRDARVSGTDRINAEETTKESAILQAEAAMNCLEMTDIAEIRSLACPPAKVKVVMEAVMVLLTGKTLPWKDLRKLMSNGQRFITMLVSLNKNRISKNKLSALCKYIHDPEFRPEIIQTTSSAAARFCSWVLGAFQYAAVTTGNYAILYKLNSEGGKTSSKDPVNLLPPVQKRSKRESSTSKRVRTPILRGERPSSRRNFRSKGTRNFQRPQGRYNDLNVLRNIPSLSDFSEPTRSASAEGKSPYVKTAKKNRKNGYTKKQKMLRKKIQQKQNLRLSRNASQGLEDDVSSIHEFQCSDGASFPYKIVGTIDMDLKQPAFVVLNDMFDTYESKQILFRNVLRQKKNTQILYLNFPGQAYSMVANMEHILNNSYYSDVLCQLLHKLEKDGAFITSCRPWYMVGFGFGANVGAHYLSQGKGAVHRHQKGNKGLITVNGFGYVDKQLAAILHSSINVFSCFPDKRPDLPISYFSRFLFSETYLKKVDKNLVLNIYTAISNPITNASRISICEGILNGVDLRSSLRSINVPVISVQSTNNALVNAKHVDPFLDGREATHIWSHQGVSTTGLTNTQKEKIRALVARSFDRRERRKREALVLWMDAGHEVCQESRKSIVDIVDIVASVTKADKQKEIITDVDDGNDGAQQHKDVAPELQVAKLLVEAEEGKNLQVEGETEIERAERIMQAKRQYESKIQEYNNSQRKEKDLHRVKNKSDARILLCNAERGSDKISVTHVQGLSIGDRVLINDGTNTEEIVTIGHISPPNTLHIRGVVELLNEIGAPVISISEKNARDDEIIHQLKEKMQNRLETYKQETADKEKRQQKAIQRDVGVVLEEQKIRKQQWESANKSIREKRDHVAKMRRMKENEATKIAFTKMQKEENKVVAQQNKEIQRLKQEALKNTLPKSENSLMNVFENMENQSNKSSNDNLQRVQREHEEQVEAYERMKRQLREGEIDREKMKEEKRLAREKRQQEASAVLLQALIRGKLGRKEKKRRVERVQIKEVGVIASVRCQAMIRRFLARVRIAKIRDELELARHKLELAMSMQRVYRGHAGRKIAMKKLRERSARIMQRVARGRFGRLKWMTEHRRQQNMMERFSSAAKIQSLFRMYKGQLIYQQRFMEDLAANVVQRVYRGTLARRRVKRKREWQSTQPGPQRLQLGLRLIENSKESFERQRQELNSLHRKQMSAEANVSVIHANLVESEKDLKLLEKELQDIDQLDQDLRELTHEKALFDKRIEKDGRKLNAMSLGKSHQENDDEDLIFSAQDEAKRKKDQSDAYALEMAIHVKRAEREQKKKELESEFTGIMEDMSKKRAELAKLQMNIEDMELTRQRKDREFARIQRDLMELLEEQKKELDNVREKGVELETAMMTSAKASQRTAQIAEEHEKKSQAIFQGTEELLKFQFMSMSLGYFNSLNMLKSLRDINSDTTTSAIKTSAQNALAAAVTATAANIPTMKHLNLGGQDVIKAIEQKKKIEEAERQRLIKESKGAMENQFPDNVKEWTVKDVGNWLDTLMIGQYKKAFEEAAIDGMFLLQLTESDLGEVLGVDHPLHRKKLLYSRSKLAPLTAKEITMKKEVQHEQLATNLRVTETSPNDIDTIFSYARNGRRRKLEDAIDGGFDMNAEDEFGNTLLITASQQVNLGLCEVLIRRGCDVNRQNFQGNTALHYAMAYDPSGDLGEYLISQGCDDTLENKWGLSPYDGISQEDA